MHFISMRMRTIHAAVFIAVVVPVLLIRQLRVLETHTKFRRNQHSRYVDGQNASEQPAQSAQSVSQSAGEAYRGRNVSGLTPDVQRNPDPEFREESNWREAPSVLDTRWPRRVFFLWCGVQDFSFVNFLSLQSAIRSVNPSTVLLAYAYYDEVKHKYFKRPWLRDIETTFPFLQRYKISTDDHLCVGSQPTKSTEIITSFLQKRHFLGCLYIAGQTVLIEPFRIQNADITLDFIGNRTGQGFLYVPTSITQQVHHDICPLADETKDVQNVCLVLDSSRFGPNFSPASIMFNPSPLASQLRLIMYGTRAYPYHKADSRNPAPNIAHYVWLGGGKMDYTFFMSVLSVIFLGKVHKVYVHGDKPPAGELWHKLQDMDVHNQLQHVPWHRPRAIFGRKVNSIQNQADLVKSSIMWTWGGIMMDPDAMFVRPPDPEMFHYDTLITSGRLPVMLNPAVTISKPKSEYARQWLESEKEFVNGHYVWDCCFKMYLIWVRKPWIAKYDRQYNFHCPRGYCYPTWATKFAVNDSNVLRSIPDWTKKTVTIHFPNPNPYSSFEQCAFQLNGIAGQLARMVLRAAGLLAENEGLVP